MIWNFTSRAVRRIRPQILLPRPARLIFFLFLVGACVTFSRTPQV